MTSLRRLLLAAVLGLLLLPAAASAQATRTWVSGVGDDVNPCSRTAPCKTFAGAISKTAEGGEINAIDAGGYGAVTITKSITIDGNGTNASILACGTNGVTVNTVSATLPKVTLRDLRITGCGNTTNPGFYGVRLLRAAVLRIEDTKIFGFQTAGVFLEPNHLKSRTIIQNTSIYENGVYGILAKPRAGGNLRTTVKNARIDENGNGVVASSTFGPSKVKIVDSDITDSGLEGANSGFGVWAGAPNASIRIGDSEITGNTKGLHFTNGGDLISYGGNIVDDNTTDGDFTGSVARK